ncbi:E3 ubiquitin-protein ligase RGLG3 [Glycine max]|nr:E3 ubiquitin-protein ligase RGLG3 [Glycine max]
MGNGESTHDSHDDFFQQPLSYDDFFRQPLSYDGCSADISHQYHQPASYDGSSVNTSHQYHQPSTYAESSVNTRHQHKQRPTYIADNFSSLDQVVSALREAGLESSNLIIGIDFTKNNEWTASTHDQNVFSFYRDERYCHGFEEVLARYREIVPHLNWQPRASYAVHIPNNKSRWGKFTCGPTSFAPVIDAAVGIVERSNGQYHVLVIIADGQVTRNSDTPHGKFSPQEKATINFIIAASYSDYQPLSPQLFWLELEMDHGMMQHFDDNITQRLFDNFQSFALAALMEIPIQYRITQNLQIANENPTSYQHKRPLPSSCSRISMLLTESTCKECGVTLSSCPMCRQEITTRLRLYT